MAFSAIAAAATTVAAVSSVRSANAQAKAGRQAAVNSERAFQAETEARNRANQKKPNLTAIMAANKRRGTPTDLTRGSAAVTPDMIGRTNVLGG